MQRRLRRNRMPLQIAGVLLFVGVVAYAGYMNSNQLAVNTATCQSLLTLIGKAESNNNYNAYFGNAANVSVLFTDMSIAEVLEWQQSFVQQGNASSAVGRYQIINTTLRSLVAQLGISTSETFSPAVQDKLAIALLERRGVVDYANGRTSSKEFAASLAKEWAALPKTVGTNPENSYYASDGLNRSRVQTGEVLRAISLIRTM